MISGSAGIIGSPLVGRLAKQNEIMLFDNLARNTIPLTDLGKHKNLSLVQGSILNPASVSAAAKAADIVVHPAAIAVTLSSTTTVRVEGVRLYLCDRHPISRKKRQRDPVRGVNS